jgi:hypothetical protein
VGGLKRTTYNGTTSGCPPPSQRHNYRRALHTQQRNRSERCNSGRFWKGVAQITRNRERAFTASLCSITLFQNSSICHPDRCAGSGCVGFPLLALRPTPNRAGQSHSSAAKMLPEDVQRTTLRLRPRYRPLAYCRCASTIDRRAKDSTFAADRGSASGVRTASDAINHIFRAEKAISICIGNTRCRCVAPTAPCQCMRGYCHDRAYRVRFCGAEASIVLPARLRAQRQVFKLAWNAPFSIWLR